MKTSKLAQNALTALIFSTSVMLSSAGVVFASEQLTQRPTVQHTQASERQSVSTKININLANFEQLVALPGIGKVKANAIISYREDVGMFESVSDIQNIKGIGAKLYAKLMDRIEVQ